MGAAFGFVVVVGWHVFEGGVLGGWIDNGAVDVVLAVFVGVDYVHDGFFVFASVGVVGVLVK